MVAEQLLPIRGSACLLGFHVRSENLVEPSFRVRPLNRIEGHAFSLALEQ
jgi:hypothetical protein